MAGLGFAYLARGGARAMELGEKRRTTEATQEGRSEELKLRREALEGKIAAQAGKPSAEETAADRARIRQEAIDRSNAEQVEARKVGIVRDEVTRLGRAEEVETNPERRKVISDRRMALQSRLETGDVVGASSLAIQPIEITSQPSPSAIRASRPELPKIGSDTPDQPWIVPTATTQRVTSGEVIGSASRENAANVRATGEASSDEDRQASENLAARRAHGARGLSLADEIAKAGNRRDPMAHANAINQIERFIRVAETNQDPNDDQAGRDLKAGLAEWQREYRTLYSPDNIKSIAMSNIPAAVRGSGVVARDVNGNEIPGAQEEINGIAQDAVIEEMRKINEIDRSMPGFFREGELQSIAADLHRRADAYTPGLARNPPPAGTTRTGTTRTLGSPEAESNQSNSMYALAQQRIASGQTNPLREASMLEESVNNGYTIQGGKRVPLSSAARRVRASVAQRLRELGQSSQGQPTAPAQDNSITGRIGQVIRAPINTGAPIPSLGDVRRFVTGR